jgi:mono/diheme cytochrome c family protein
MKHSILILFTFLLITLAVSCRGYKEPGSEHVSGGEDAHSEENEFAHYEGPIASSDIPAGHEVFNNYCNGCHPGAGQGYGPSIVEHAHTASRLRRLIREGEDKMPSFTFEDIDDESLEDLLAYLESINAIKK